MTRCSKTFLIIASAIAGLLASVNVVAAQDLRTDAFGVIPTPGADEPRLTWADSHGTRSGPAQDILLFVGPKSLVAGAEQGQAVALAFDRFGNLVADDEALFHIQPNEGVQTARVIDGIAATGFSAGTEAGSYHVGVEIGQAQSAGASYRVVADVSSLRPRTVAPEAAIPFEEATRLGTHALADPYGNPVDDGISAQMLIAHEDGSYSLVSPIVVAGRGEALFHARDVSSSAMLTTSLGTASAAPVRLELETITESAPVPVRLRAERAIDAIHLSAGPFRTERGYVLDDGALVLVQVTSSAGRMQVVNGWVFEGMFEALLPLGSKDGPFRVELQSALGTQVITALPAGGPQ